MSETAGSTISIAAEPAAVLAVIADFGTYCEWADGIRSAQVVETGEDGRPRHVRFVLDAGVIRDDYVLAYDWAPDGSRVDWQLVRSQMQKMQNGSYTLVADGSGGTVVTYALAVELAIPMLGLFKRKAEKVVIDTALRDLRTRVESGSAWG